MSILVFLLAWIMQIHTKISRMKNRIVVTITDYNRIMGFIELASLKAKMPKSIAHLYDKLTAANMLPQESINAKVITMNSRVLLKELSSEREIEITITYPQQAKPLERKVSVFSDIGIALIGRQERDIVSWHVPDSIGVFEIVKVMYQPEAAGDYHL